MFFYLSLCEIFLTCKNSTGLRCHVNLVLSGYVQHHGFGPPVVLGGQQPAQRLGKNPAEGKKETQKDRCEGHGECTQRMKTEFVVKARRRTGQKAGKEEETIREREYCLLVKA